MTTWRSRRTDHFGRTSLQCRLVFAIPPSRRSKATILSKGIFTQTFVVLLRETVSIESVKKKLSDFSRSQPLSAQSDWAFSGPAILLDIDEQTEGKVVLDIVSHPWPDEMRDNKQSSSIEKAFEQGHFGPFTFPGALRRATQQSWNWEEGKTATRMHQAFIRLRCSYVLDDSAQVSTELKSPNLPKNYDPYNELAFMTEVVGMLLEMSQAICYFNPGGEVLSDLELLTANAEFSVEHSLPPVEIWANMRFSEVDEDWSVMDTIGHAQLDIPDVEGCFRPQDYDAEEVENFLRDVGIYLLQNGDIIQNGETSEGPGEILWKAQRCAKPYTGPKRTTLRWFPDDKETPPAELR